MLKKTGLLLLIMVLFAAVPVTPVCAYAPVDVSRQAVLCAGFSNSAAITPDGTLYMWGDNSFGQLGKATAGNVKDHSEQYQTVPLKVMENVSSVSCCYDETIVLKKDGTVWTWGSRTAVENLDDPSDVEPRKMLDDAIAVSTETGSFAAIRSDGSLWMWGNNAWGRYGNGTSGYSSSTPIRVMEDVAVFSGEGSTFMHTSAVVKTDGSLWGWGPMWGFDNYAVPYKIMDGVKNVSCGEFFAAVIKKDDSLWIVPAGDEALNEYGELGIGSTENLKRPVKIMDNVKQADVGDHFCAAVKKDGTLWTWGLNSGGQLGNGMKGNGKVSFMDNGIIQTSPVKIMNQVNAVSCGGEHMLAQKTDGTFWAWGANVRGEVGNGRKGNYYLDGIFPYQTTPVKISLPIRQFSDVPFDAYYADPVVWAVEQGITSGTSKTTFSPNAGCSRAHAVTFLWRAAGSPAPDRTEKPFSDVAEGKYYTDAVCWAVEQGITNGMTETEFSPDTVCTRGQIAAFLWRFHGSPEVSAESGFADVPANAFYAKPVTWAVEQGITNGIDKEHFGTGQNCTRGQIVTFLYRGKMS